MGAGFQAGCRFEQAASGDARDPDDGGRRFVARRPATCSGTSRRNPSVTLPTGRAMTDGIGVLSAGPGGPLSRRAPMLGQSHPPSRDARRNGLAARLGVTALSPILSRRRAILCHVDIRGAAMNDGVCSRAGLARSAFPSGVPVFSGHFHKPHSIGDGFMRYVGSPYQVSGVYDSGFPRPLAPALLRGFA